MTNPNPPDQQLLHYHPGVFDRTDEKGAREIILTNEGEGADTETRWRVETPYVLALLSGALKLGPESLVLDYGCGIGRMAKAMIEASGCSVIGVDISAPMRTMAQAYVGSERFLAVSPAQFDLLVAAGLRVQAAISIWVLQHCLAPVEDIERIHRSLAPQGEVFILNMPKRAVPAVVPATGTFTWAHDGIDVAALLRGRFTLRAEGEPDKTRTPNMADAGAFWMSLVR